MSLTEQRGCYVRRYNFGMTSFRKWQLFSPLGLTLIGAGISLTDHASFLKSQGEAWFWLGTFGLVVLNSGIALVADAVKNRVMHELGR